MQLGLPELEALRANRMPHRWVATETCHEPPPPGEDAALPRVAVALHCDFDALPFDSASLDLVVLPHALELARDPHLALREVERVLVPEGRVVIVGFNPASLWGVRQRLGRLRRRCGGVATRACSCRARASSSATGACATGCACSASRSRPAASAATSRRCVRANWLARFGWMERTGDRWWPVFGAVYFVVAVKRVRGMRLVGLMREQRARAHRRPPAPATASAVTRNSKATHDGAA